LIFDVYGGIVSYRMAGGEYGAYCRHHPDIWEQTRSASEAELRAKLRAIGRSPVRHPGDISWSDTAIGKSQEAARRAALRGASVMAARAGVAEWDRVTDWRKSVTDIALEAGATWNRAKREKERRIAAALALEVCNADAHRV
jgi:hypothetical protein